MAKLPLGEIPAPILLGSLDILRQEVFAAADKVQAHLEGGVEVDGFAELEILSEQHREVIRQATVIRQELIARGEAVPEIQIVRNTQGWGI